MRSLLCLPLLLCSLPLLADTLRCDNQLISTGDHASEVLEKCGEPNSRDTLGYQERVGPHGRFEEVRIDEWVYGPRNGMYYYLRFEANRLVEIDSNRGR